MEQDMSRKQRAVFIALLAVTVGSAGHTAAKQLPSSECRAGLKGSFSIGWTEVRADGSRFRCVPTFDATFGQTGAAWIKVATDGRPDLR